MKNKNSAMIVTQSKDGFFFSLETGKTIREKIRTVIILERD